MSDAVRDIIHAVNEPWAVDILLERLRGFSADRVVGWVSMGEAADLIEEQQAQIERLRNAVRRGHRLVGDGRTCSCGRSFFGASKAAAKVLQREHVSKLVEDR
jgi:hypothetical protein